MKKFTIALENADGSLQRMIGPGEARWLIDHNRVKKIKKSSRMTLRLIPSPKPSTAADSPCSITVSDILINAGVIERSHGKRKTLKEKIKAWGEPTLQVVSV